MRVGEKRIEAVLPKLLGIALVIVALSYAFDSNWPVPLGEQLQAARKAAAPGDPPVHSLEVRAAGEAPAAGLEFAWEARFESPDWRVVLLDGQHRELAWSRALPGTIYRPEGDFARVLQTGSGRFWYVLGQYDGRQLRSVICPIEPR